MLDGLFVTPAVTAIVEALGSAKADGKLAKVDQELQELHAELTGYWEALMTESAGTNGGAHGSFHALVGRWLAIADSLELARLEGKADSIALGDLADVAVFAAQQAQDGRISVHLSIVRLPAVWAIAGAHTTSVWPSQLIHSRSSA